MPPAEINDGEGGGGEGGGGRQSVRAVDELSRAATARNSTRRVPHRREDRKTQLLSLSLSLSLSLCPVRRVPSKFPRRARFCPTRETFFRLRRGKTAARARRMTD